MGTAHGAQTLASIKLTNIYATPKGVEIKISDAIKTSRPGRFQPLLALPRFSEDPSLCEASVVLKYIDVTKSLRGDVGNLFITLRKPHNAIRSQTVSRWIKTVLSRSGVDMSVFSAHSTRHSASSAALANGVDINTTRRTAGWSDTSQTFAKFYNEFALRVIHK